MGFNLFNKKYISKQSKIGKNVHISKDCLLQQKNCIADNCVIKNSSYLTNCCLNKNVNVISSTLEDCTIEEGSNIGPYSRIRPKTTIGKNCKIGNFVEIKNSKIGDDTKVSHLAYVGDATIGKNCNIGCGVVFGNYDGQNKHKTIIGDNCFIGSNCTLIAPLEIGDSCFICAGSVVTESVPANTFVIARSRQTNKFERAEKYLKGKKIWNTLEQME